MRIYSPGARRISQFPELDRIVSEYAVRTFLKTTTVTFVETVRAQPSGCELVLQVRVNDPLGARLDLAPNFAERILGRPTRSIAKAAVIKKWFEDRLQPIAQRLLTYPVDDRGDAKRAPF